MDVLQPFLPDTLSPLVALGLVGASFVASFITIAFGIGGGVFLLAFMASALPPQALIPVHGVIQLGSNAGRAALMIAHVDWPPVAAFALGSALGAALGGLVVTDLPAGGVLIGVGLFVLWSVFFDPPRWLSRSGPVTGVISSFLTMFFGATGPFVATYVKSLKLDRRRHVATHGTFMTLQHCLKVVTFGLLGFGFGPWMPFTLAMIASGFAGTVAGRSLLIALSDKGFKRALDVVLVLLALRLIWSGIAAL